MGPNSAVLQHTQDDEFRAAKGEQKANWIEDLGMRAS